MPHDDLNHIVEIPPFELMGPAMRNLNDRQRRFVCALAATGGDQFEAYQWAGYTTANNNVARANGSRLAASEDVKDAIREEALRRLDSAAVMAVSTLVEIAGPRSAAKTRDRISAANSLLDRIAGFGGKTEHNIVIKDERTNAELIAFITEKAGAVGLDARKLLQGPDVVDAEFAEVDPDLADLL